MSRASNRKAKRPRAQRPAAEGLEARLALDASLPTIVMVSATTADSQSVTVDYTIENAPVNQPIDFGVYRSADTHTDAGAVAVGTVTVFDPRSGHPTLDRAGQPATRVGTHEVVLPLPGGLPPNPSHPYVVVVADPQHAVAEASRADDTAAFRKYVIGVITHGGIQPMAWHVAGPPWERWMAAALRQQGYDTVIPYNWVADSNHAGRAARQGPRLAREVADAASAFPAGAPVDVHFIGHSEGTVVNALAIEDLANMPAPGIAAGYLKDTLLDPHAASNGVSGPQYSVAPTLLGQLARAEIDRFQSRANDPPAFVPANVDDAEVFYQHTPVGQTHSSNGGLYNLWGQVPVRGSAHYFNLTGPGISHAGSFGVQDWYGLNVVPTLGTGDSLVESNVLTVAPGPAGAAATRGRTEVADTTAPTYHGTAAPGATVRLIAAPAHSRALGAVGQTVAAPDGTWSLTTRPLAPGTYRLKAVADVPTPAGQRPVPIRPTAWPNPVVIPPGA